MLTTKINTEETQILNKLKVLAELLKIRLSFLVSFSACFGYAFALGNNVVWIYMLGLAVGGFLVAGCAIVINQIIEKDIDRQMQRTQYRPLPTEKISTKEAKLLAIVVGLTGVIFLSIATNALTVFLAVISIFLYGFVYTPLKRVGVVAVFVGAIPGALPPLLGWVAATNQITNEAIAIFLVQFFWQFPHFWAIAWVLDEDYKKVGFKMLPSPIYKTSAWHIFIYTLILIPVSLLPFVGGMVGIFSTIIIILCGLVFLYTTFKLLRTCTKKDALRIMFASFFYLPVVQIVYLLDRL